jgi:hypothetical protein
VKKKPKNIGNFFFQNLPTVNNLQISVNSPNLVTLISGRKNLRASSFLMGFAFIDSVMHDDRDAL